MSSRRFYCSDFVSKSVIELGSEEARHLSRVLRAKPDDEIELFDGQGRQAVAFVEAINRASVTCRVDQVVERSGRGRTAITALVALPRGGAADDVVRHLVECGIHAFGEVIAERSVRRVRQRGGNDNQVRFERLSLSAMKQCGLNVMPQLHPTCTVSELQCAPQTLGVFGSTAGTAPLLHEYVESLDRVPDAIAFVVGPEGGWTPAEEACLVDAGFSQVSLGPTTLRIETASIAMATFLAALR